MSISFLRLTEGENRLSGFSEYSIWENVEMAKARVTKKKKRNTLVIEYFRIVCLDDDVGGRYRLRHYGDV